jgi:hypothetical protein
MLNEALWIDTTFTTTSQTVYFRFSINKRHTVGYGTIYGTNLHSNTFLDWSHVRSNVRNTGSVNKGKRKKENIWKTNGKKKVGHTGEERGAYFFGFPLHPPRPRRGIQPQPFPRPEEPRAAEPRELWPLGAWWVSRLLTAVKFCWTLPLKIPSSCSVFHFAAAVLCS